MEFRDYSGAKYPKINPKIILITIDGAIELLLKTRKRITPDVLHILKKFNIETINKKCLTKEQQTLSTIGNAFKTEKIEDQYKIGKYYLDMYFQEYKIVVECDENGHADRKPCDERERMDFVNETLNIDDSHWIRYNPDEYDFDISKVINKIYRKINELKDEKESKNNKNQIRVSDISKIFEKENPILDYEIEDKYTIDLFFPKQKIIFEFDKKDTSRENYINTFLGINNSHWIIFNTNDETFNISNVIGQLYILMKDKEIYLKMCATCRKEKPSTDFHNSKNTSDGLSIRCRECRSNITVNKNQPIPRVEMPDRKNCPQCETEKPSTNFWKNPVRKDGLDSVCISCRKDGEQKIINAPKVIKETKICSKCKKVKNTTIDFGKRKKSFDGYQGVCKTCEKDRCKIRLEKLKNEKKIVEEFKKCVKCNEIKKTETYFFKSAKCKDGYSGVCKNCKSNTKVIKKY
jgi:very-short-patch-repair endonuclease